MLKFNPAGYIMNIKNEKFNPGTKFKHKGNGLGIENGLKRLIAVRPSTWKPYSKIFKVIISGAKLAKYPVIGSIYKRVMMFSPYKKRFTQGVVVNLNVDLTEKGQGTVLPIDMMKKSVREASYLASFDKCICRTNKGCKDYPVDFGCIFLGEGAKGLVKNGVAHQISASEAEAKIDRAASLGLVGQSLWVEVEQYLWGIQNEHMEKFLEFCFCCPCCCTALHVTKNSTRDVRSRFKSLGWMAEVNDNCINCGKCIEVCPQHAIKSAGDKAIVDDQCFGCGLCKNVCPASAIDIRLKKELKNDIKDYFNGLNLEL